MIKEESYPDFVATIKQENTPPGATETIDIWLDNGDFQKKKIFLI